MNKINNDLLEDHFMMITHLEPVIAYENKRKYQAENIFSTQKAYEKKENYAKKKWLTLGTRKAP